MDFFFSNRKKNEGSMKKGCRRNNKKEREIENLIKYSRSMKRLRKKIKEKYRKIIESQERTKGV